MSHTVTPQLLATYGTTVNRGDMRTAEGVRRTLQPRLMIKARDSALGACGYMLATRGRQRGNTPALGLGRPGRTRCRRRADKLFDSLLCAIEERRSSLPVGFGVEGRGANAFVRNPLEHSPAAAPDMSGNMRHGPRHGSIALAVSCTAVQRKV